MIRRAATARTRLSGISDLQLTTAHGEPVGETFLAHHARQLPPSAQLTLPEV